jgi:endoglucanase
MYKIDTNMTAKIFYKLLPAVSLIWITTLDCIPSDYNGLKINDKNYFEMPGLNVMVFNDFYPEGHQGGITIIQHGVRVAANGDLRLEVSPGQWQPVPGIEDKLIDTAGNMITVVLSYPDSNRIESPFNPVTYPDLYLKYRINVKAAGASFYINVDLEEPLPESWAGKVSFNIELFPGDLFGKTYYMDNNSGVFPRQVNGPAFYNDQGNLIVKPMAKGKKLTVAPETADRRMTITAIKDSLHLSDGRILHNNGWYIVGTKIPAGVTENAVQWLVTPDVLPDWQYEPVIHISQVGYYPGQSKVAVIECDMRHNSAGEVRLQRISESGVRETVLSKTPEKWGEFLRYKYFKFDFSYITRPGIYIITYGNSESNTFIIDSNIFERHVWQPTLEYFLPVQMCHMRINDRYRVWHGMCHMDDALMAPVDTIHIDGYRQGNSTLTKYKSFEHVPGLSKGGWHDAGDYDLRVESQAGTVYILSLINEAFNIDYDETTVDQKNHIVEMHIPDGKPDILQQIEHGVISILSGYNSLGRLYRGIISSTVRQYVLLGDGVNMTDNVIELKEDDIDNPGNKLENKDDRWVFTENNPRRELFVSGCLAAASRVLRGYNDSLSAECIRVAEELWENNKYTGKYTGFAVEALAELILTTEKQLYKKQLLDMSADIDVKDVGWTIGRVLPLLDNEQFTSTVNDSVQNYLAKLDKEINESPFGVPYRPRIWGSGWHIQSLGLKQYYLYKSWKNESSREYMLNALNFILGCHPGSNTESFVSGVGTKSTIVAYGINRADWSYIPGGAVSGTALIRPDFPELKEWPYLWQQTEYVIGGGATKFMFLVLAAKQILEEED